ncbi:MAG: hypothetical protein AAF629_13070 [Chloroflexota bacterium]
MKDETQSNNQVNWPIVLWLEAQNSLDAQYSEHLVSVLPAHAPFQDTPLSNGDRTTLASILVLLKVASAVDETVALFELTHKKGRVGWSIIGWLLLSLILVMAVTIFLAGDFGASPFLMGGAGALFVWLILTFGRFYDWFMDTYSRLRFEGPFTHTNVILNQLPPRLLRYLYGHTPSLTTVEVALQQRCETNDVAQDTWQPLLDSIAAKKSQGENPENLIADLNHDQWKKRFVARHTLLHLGGEAIPGLLQLVHSKEIIQLRQTAVWVLRNIGLETSHRIANQAKNLICLRCITHCKRHKVSLSRWETVSYYGCRSCHNSREIIERPAKIIALLDSSLTNAPQATATIFRINWFQQKMILDFDAVEIQQASDQDIETFLLEIQNRQVSSGRSDFKKMACYVSSECHLADNTINLLHHTFGQVVPKI